MTEKQGNQERQETITRGDPLDLGVPMAPGEGPKGPEDAFDPDARGDYSGRVGEGESYEIRLIGYRTDGTPIIEKVKQS